MELKIDLSIKSKKAAALIVLLACAAICSYLSIKKFIIRSLSDDSLIVLRSTIRSAAAYYPDSPRLQSRLLAVELEEATGEEDLPALAHIAERTTSLSRWNSNYYLLRADVYNLRGDLDGAELALKQAVALAPNYTQVHWQLANLLVRQGKTAEAIQEFQFVLQQNSAQALVPAALEVLWNLADGDVATLRKAVGNTPVNQMRLAQYLVAHQRYDEALTIFSAIDRAESKLLPQTKDVINAFVNAGKLDQAYQAWMHVVNHPDYNDGGFINGGFETEPAAGYDQFGWRLGKNDFAVFSFDRAIAQAGKQSLRIRFTGRDTTRLERELIYPLVLPAGAKYQLSFFAKSDSLVTTEGIRVVILNPVNSAALASSAPIESGTQDWQLYRLEFTVPANSSTLLLAVQRIPKFSYDAPTEGVLWLDSFRLNPIGSSK